MRELSYSKIQNRPGSSSVQCVADFLNSSDAFLSLSNTRSPWLPVKCNEGMWPPYELFLQPITNTFWLTNFLPRSHIFSFREYFSLSDSLSHLALLLTLVRVEHWKCFHPSPFCHSPSLSPTLSLSLSFFSLRSVGLEPIDEWWWNGYGKRIIETEKFIERDKKTARVRKNERKQECEKEGAKRADFLFF